MKKFIEKHKQSLNTILIVFLVFKALSLISNYWYTLVEPFDLPRVRSIYTHSQYNLKNAEFYGNIDDDMLYQYAGHNYIHGSDPSLINPETPFFVKYLYGLGILIFKNAVFVQNIFALLLLFVVYKITHTFTKDTTISLIASSLFSLDKIFTFQSFHTLLDLPHALFVLCTFYAFTLFSQEQNQKRSSKFILAASIFIGLVAATKFYITAVIIYFTLLAFTPKSLKNITMLTVPSLIVYLATFSVYFFYHPNIIDFISHHISGIRLYLSYIPEYPWGELLRIIYMGSWRTWWGEAQFIKVDVWSLMWPLTTTIVLLAPIIINKTKRTQILPMYTFTTLYIFTNLFHVVFPRYILTIFPLMVILSLITLTNLTLPNVKLKPISKH